MSTSILVTGAKGQLGCELNECSAGHPEYRFMFTDIDQLDITRYDQLEAFILREQPTVIINCAAYTAVDKAESEPELAAKLNIEAVKHLARLALEHNILLVHISTDYVFDGLHHKPYAENHPLNPAGVYASSKAEGELSIRRSKCKHLILRTSWLYSSYGNNFLKTILRLSSERDSLGIVADQTGSPTYAADLAEALLKILPSVIENPALCGTYHLSNEGSCSWYDFASEIVMAEHESCKVIPIETHEYPLPAPRPFFSVLSKSLLRKTFGIEMPHWRVAMLRCLHKINTHG